jgi:protocatechuate 3,4-dioxygenase beta subunit
MGDQVRRRLLGAGAGGLAVWALSGPASWAAAVVATPPQAAGPFYPLQIPLDRDNDLTHVQGMDGQAHGAIFDVYGRLTDDGGRPMPGVQIEIWQVNGFGRYHHPHDEQDLPWDPRFQGFGRTLTDEQGGYRFRTVRPVAYPGRAPHIHFALRSPRFATFYTQLYLAGAPENERDFLLARVRDPKARERLIVSLEPSPAKGAEFAGRFDIALGETWLSRSP